MDNNLSRLNAIKSALAQREESALRPFACFSTSAIRRKAEESEDSNMEVRQAFSMDADRILHSLAFTRYLDKTQVFSLIHNDHLTYRGLHVQMVSKIGRTIGRALGLNEDLIEAAALGHDIGHPPFGHDGENFLSSLTQEAGIGRFCHNLQSIQSLEKIERKGRGWNLTLQTQDAIMCHNGEAYAETLTPGPQLDFEQIDLRIRQSKADPDMDLIPMTLEGCVVRMADSIAYVGRDLEDGIRLDIVNRNQIPDDCRKILGETNGTIVFSLVTDLVANSLGKNFLQFSQETAKALETLKQFNYKFIYKNPAIKEHLTGIQDIFRYFFDTYLTALETDKRDSIIFTDFLRGKDSAYVENHGSAEIVRDFIAGMTDSYFVRHAPENLAPRWVDDLRKK